MKKAIFRCEIITPMFMLGADQRSVELRPSEFKGMMRFWRRTVKAEKDKDQLRKEEAKIFGGTGENEGKSKVSIRINKHFPPPDKIGNNIQEEIRNEDGLKYLLYSTFALKAKGKRIVRKYIKPGYEFEIVLSSHDEKALRQAIASLWLATYLGGFGTRSRRGAGCVHVLDVEQGKEFLEGLSFVPDVKDSASFLNWLKENTEKAAKIISENRKTDFISTYPNIYFSRIKISENGFNSWINALNDLGRFYLDFRYAHKNSAPEHGVFGLPVMHRSRDAVTGKIGGEGINRHASPLIFKVIKSNNKYYWLMLRLIGEFLPEGGVLVFGKKTEQPSYEIIDEFWNSVSGNEEILLIPDKLNEIKQKILKELNPKRIYVFGSRARGDFHKKSDLDIAIEGGLIEKLDISGNLDLVNLNKADTFLKQRIKKEGVLIYESKD